MPNGLSWIALKLRLPLRRTYKDEATGDVYYRINVRNFAIFYVVKGQVMEVRWFRYSRRQFP